MPEIFPVEASITGIKVPSIQTKKIKLLKSQQIYQTKPNTHTHKQKQKLLKILEEPQESPAECVSESVSLSQLTVKARG